MTPLHDRARTLQRVCEALAQGDRRQASEVARREYPFAPQTRGWKLLPPGDPSAWDGLVPWFLSFISRCPEHLQDGYIKTWHAAVTRSWK
jgi:hypothetical protein